MFNRFVTKLIEMHKLVEGDYFCVDGAFVYHGSKFFPLLCKLLDTVGVHLIFLPKYSPELNPCEEIFTIMKHHLRCYCGSARF